MFSKGADGFTIRHCFIHLFLYSDNLAWQCNIQTLSGHCLKAKFSMEFYVRLGRLGPRDSGSAIAGYTNWTVTQIRKPHFIPSKWWILASNHWISVLNLDEFFWGKMGILKGLQAEVLRNSREIPNVQQIQSFNRQFPDRPSLPGLPLLLRTPMTAHSQWAKMLGRSSGKTSNNRNISLNSLTLCLSNRQQI